MGKNIPNNYDVVGTAPPSADSGYGFEENPGIKPPTSIPNTPGENATNSTEPRRVSKGVVKKSKPDVYMPA
jgi:hypothetical protein